MDVAIISALIGAIAATITSAIWSRLEERRKRNRMRTMIGLELANNLDALRNFCAEVDQRVTFQSPQIANMERGDALSTIVLPAFVGRVWESLTPDIPMALDEGEIKDVYHFYKQLDELSRLKGISRDPHSQWHKQVDAVITDLLGTGVRLNLPGLSADTQQINANGQRQLPS